VRKWRRYARHYEGLGRRVAITIIMALGKAAAAAFFALTLSKLVRVTLGAGESTLIEQSAIFATFLAVLLAGIPIAGVLAVIALILGIAQVPALLITLPVIVYVWASGDYSTGAAIAHTIILLVTGMADNVLKPMMLGRGVDVPMPVILIGALGGMASGGILGMFVGATALALGYELSRSWLATSGDSDPASAAPRTS